MVVFGKEVNFRRSVQANYEIAEICPDGDINKFNVLINGPYKTAQTAAARFMAAMSRAYEDYANFTDPEHKPDPVTERELMMLDGDEFNDLFLQALNVFADDGKTTVETEPVKKTENEAGEAGPSD